MSRTPARILINKGFTLEVMGDYEGAVEALRQAEPRLDKRSEPRFWSTQRFNLAVNFSHLGRHAEARDFLEQVREVVITLRLPDSLPQAADRIPAKEAFANREELTPDQRIAVVRIATEYQTWAIYELAVERSLAEEGAVEVWAELAVEISEYVGGTKEWQNRVRGYAMAAEAKVLMGAGKVREAGEVSKEAWRLWGAGVDAGGLLEGGRVGLEG